jgi:hypothetical protein
MLILLFMHAYDYHFVRERVANVSLAIWVVSSKDHVVGVFTKTLPVKGS